MNYLPHFFGLLAFISWVFSVQCKKKGKILLIQIIANIFYFIQYFLLNLRITAFLNILTIVRCFIIINNERKKKSNSVFILTIFLLIHICIVIFGVNNYIGIIPIIASILYTISTWCKNTIYLRAIFILCAFIFCFYNLYVGAYVSFIGNIVEMLSGGISLYRFKKESKS